MKREEKQAHFITKQAEKSYHLHHYSPNALTQKTKNSNGETYGYENKRIPKTIPTRKKHNRQNTRKLQIKHTAIRTNKPSHNHRTTARSRQGGRTRHQMETQKIKETINKIPEPPTQPIQLQHNKTIPKPSKNNLQAQPNRNPRTTPTKQETSKNIHTNNL